MNNARALVNTGSRWGSIFDQAIVVRLFNPLVDDGSRPDARHLAEYCSLVFEGSGWDSVALNHLVSHGKNEKCRDSRAVLLQFQRKISVLGSSE